jgi:hypothetical protein
MKTFVWRRYVSANCKRWQLACSHSKTLQDAGSSPPHARHDGALLRQEPTLTQRPYFVGLITTSEDQTWTGLVHKAINTNLKAWALKLGGDL